MSEWPNVRLGDIATHIKDGTHGSYERTEEGVPFLSAKNIQHNGKLAWDKSDDLISDVDYLAITSSFAPQRNDLLITIVGSIGRSALFDGSKVAFQRSVAFVRPSKAMNENFLHHASTSPHFLAQLNRRSNITAQAGLYLGELAKISIPLPPLETQSQIALVLSSIDTTITQTEALIAKYQQIKAGLMHDLFTRGVLPNGQLRPPREQAPHLYKQTELGWVPIDWSITTCDAVCERIIDCKNRTPPITPDGHPVIRTPNVRNGVFEDSDLVYTDAKSYEIWTARGQPQPGDVVITREAPVGEVCMIPERHPAACLGQRMMLYRPQKALIDPTFFLHALQSRQIQNRLDLISGGSTVGHVKVGDIRSLWMFLPESHAEQQLIGRALETAEMRLLVQQQNRAKLQKQKLGLMQDLLTGKVQVPAQPTA